MQNISNITLKPIGVIHSSFKEPASMPIQSSGVSDAKGHIEIFPEFVDGIRDLNGFSHIYVLFYFHLSQSYNLTPIPFLDTVPRGLFSTRAPRRPNPIGLSIVTIEDIKDNIIQISGIDMVDKTPLLDIKPFIPNFEPKDNVRTGWMTKSPEEILKKKSDERFIEKE